MYYNGYDGFHSRLMGVTEEQGPVMGSFETYRSVAMIAARFGG